MNNRYYKGRGMSALIRRGISPFHKSRSATSQLLRERNFWMAKAAFLEEQISALMTLHDKGGTLPVFPNMEEWEGE